MRGSPPRGGDQAPGERERHEQSPHAETHLHRNQIGDVAIVF